MRLFIAVECPDPVKKHLQDISQGVRACARSGTFSNIENMHVTLVFLGEVDSKRVPDITMVMNRVISPSFDIEIGTLGSFKGHPGDIHWLGINSGSELFRLVNMLRQKLVKLGFDIDRKPFKPHLTLGRRIVIADHRAYENLDHTLKPVRFQADEIVLMESTRVDGKLTYLPLHRSRLGTP